MRASDIIARAACGLGIYAVNQVQMYFWTPESNARMAVYVFIVTAALANVIGILLPAALMRGKASRDMQILAFCAIVVNFLSFIAFTAKNSPCVHILNHTITVISYAQLVRLLWPGYGNRSDDHWRIGIFHVFNPLGKKLYLEKAQS